MQAFLARVEDLVPSRSDIIAKYFSQMIVDVPTMLLNVSAGPF